MGVICMSQKHKTNQNNGLNDEFSTMCTERANSLLRNIIDEILIPNISFSPSNSIKTIDSLLNESLKRYYDFLYKIKLDISNKYK
jgi:hypothetical protein